MSQRTITANLSITLDGRFHGAGGPMDMGPIVKYAVTDLARDHLDRIHENATTAVLGRGNAQGFLGYWPPVADDENADPRDRSYAAWLRDVEKVVLSRTLTEAPGKNARIANAPVADVVKELAAGGNGEILVNSSPSVITDLLAADLIDRLYLLVCPEIIGSGPRLFGDGLPPSSWTIARQETGALGEMSVIYDRVR